MYLEQDFMIYLCPICKNVGWKMLKVNFVTSFIAIHKILINRSLAKPTVAEKVQDQL